MRVKDLINELQKQNQEAEIEVFVPSLICDLYESHYQKSIKVFNEKHHNKEYVVIKLLKNN